MEAIAAASPRLKARWAGVLGLFQGVTGVSGHVFILRHLMVPGNAAATAANILAHQPLLLLGFASSNIAVTCHFIWAMLFYQLFKPVHRRVAQLAAFVMVVSCALQTLAGLLYVAPLPILAGGRSFDAFTPRQLEALALVSLKLNSYVYDTHLVFFGAWCVLSGYLIVRSTFMPRAIGVLLTISGLGWMTFLSPAFARPMFPVIVAVSVVAEISLTLWLLVMGVNAQRWQEQAGAAAAPVRASGAA